jgi:DinB family protein
VRYGPFAQQRLEELADEYASVRQSTVFLLKGLDDQAWARRGTANQSAVSVRALAFIMAGHELHHRRILKEKYAL